MIFDTDHDEERILDYKQGSFDVRIAMITRRALISDRHDRPARRRHRDRADRRAALPERSASRSSMRSIRARQRAKAMAAARSSSKTRPPRQNICPNRWSHCGREADAHTPKGDVGPIDFDPVTNSQDPDVKSFKVAAEKLEADKAVIAVTITGRDARGPNPPTTSSATISCATTENGRSTISAAPATAKPGRSATFSPNP